MGGGHEPRYIYMSTFHWMPLVNGYSGYHPPSHIYRADVMKGFPGLPAIAKLKQDGVEYLIVHSSGYSPEDRSSILHSLRVDSALPYIGEFDDGSEGAAVFRMR
jgi:hypothetical protein